MKAYRILAEPGPEDYGEAPEVFFTRKEAEERIAQLKAFDMATGSESTYYIVEYYCSPPPEAYESFTDADIAELAKYKIRVMP